MKEGFGTLSRQLGNEGGYRSSGAGVSGRLTRWARVLLNYFVRRGQQRFRDGEAEGFDSLEVDDQLDFRDLLHGEIGWFLAFENAPGIDANLVVPIAEAAAITHQAAGQGVLTQWEDRRQLMPGRQRRKLFRAPGG